MDLEYKKVVVKDGKERLVLIVTQDCNLWRYIVFDTTYDENGVVSNIHRHSFIFPNKNVAKGDYIRLFTGKGEVRSFKNLAGTYTHDFFWGFEENQTVWNEGGDKMLLIKVQEFVHSRI